jgi:hypothetical protein
MSYMSRLEKRSFPPDGGDPLFRKQTGRHAAIMRKCLYPVRQLYQRLEHAGVDVWEWVCKSLAQLYWGVCESLHILFSDLRLHVGDFNFHWLDSVDDLGSFVQKAKAFVMDPFTRGVQKHILLRPFSGRFRNWYFKFCRSGSRKFLIFAETCLQLKRVVPKVPREFISLKTDKYIRTVCKEPRQSREFVNTLLEETDLCRVGQWRWQLCAADRINDFSLRACYEASRKQRGTFGANLARFGRGYGISSTDEIATFQKGIRFPSVHEFLEVWGVNAPHFRRIAALPEPLKVRFITLGHGYESPLWSSYQRGFRDCLRQLPEVESGREITVASWDWIKPACELTKQKYGDYVIVSDDGDAATDSISYELTAAVSLPQVPQFLRALWRSTLYDQRIDIPYETLGYDGLVHFSLSEEYLEKLWVWFPDLSGIYIPRHVLFEFLEKFDCNCSPHDCWLCYDTRIFWYNRCGCDDCQDRSHKLPFYGVDWDGPNSEPILGSKASSPKSLKDLAAAAVLAGRLSLDHITITPTTGQPMGDRRSFPLLCYIHYLTKKAFLRKHDLLDVRRFSINGDDGVIVLPSCLVSEYKKWMSSLWELNEIKTWVDGEIFSFNSQSYLFRGGVVKMLEKFRWNLVLKISKYGENLSDPGVWDIIRDSCPSEYQVEVWKDFCFHWKKPLKKLTRGGNNYFLPRVCGGLGLTPPDGLIYSVTPRQYLAVKMADQALARGNFPKFRTRQRTVWESEYREAIGENKARHYCFGTFVPSREKAKVSFPGRHKAPSDKVFMVTRPLPKGGCCPTPFFHLWGVVEGFERFLEDDGDSVVPEKSVRQLVPSYQSLAHHFDNFFENQIW